MWLVADRNVASLLAFRDHPHRRATSGAHGSGQKRHGATGKDLLVAVPEGTIVKDRDGTVLADLVHEGDRWLAAHAGQGGKGNARFMSNKRRAPTFAEQGEVGEERWVWLELKLMADVALVGYPERRQVHAHLPGQRRQAEDRRLSRSPRWCRTSGSCAPTTRSRWCIADIPGLIEGAAEGKGLGHQFLRHIERARVLLLTIDLSIEAEATPEEQERVLLRRARAVPARAARADHRSDRCPRRPGNHRR